MALRFAETRLERERGRLRLVDQGGNVLLELKGPEIEDAVRAGFIDPDNCHHSMFEYARMRALPSADSTEPSEYDAAFLKSLKISWN